MRYQLNYKSLGHTSIIFHHDNSPLSLFLSNPRQNTSPLTPASVLILQRKINK
jgi:hypothetical protein